MKTGAAYLLLATALLVVSGAAHPLISARDVPLEDKIRSGAADSPLYAALGDAFAQINGQSVVSKRGNPTRNDLEQGKCASNIIIYARGTNETGNMGNGPGASLQDAVDAVLPGRVIYQGVNK